MNSATISADIVSYTSLSKEDKREVERKIKELLSKLTELHKKDSFLGRIIQGDYIECAINNPTKILRLALLLKTLIKSIKLNSLEKKDKGILYFKEHGIRLAVAVAPLDTIDKKNGIIDGEAIYLSGRTIKNLSTSGKQKIIIKNTMFFRSNNIQEQEKFQTIFFLLDTLLAKCSPKQCEVIFYKLLGYNEKEISLELNKIQSTINQHSTTGGWLSIESAVNYFEKTITSWFLHLYYYSFLLIY